MRIVRADLLCLRLRLRRPFETSFARIRDRDTVLVRAFSSDGLVGYGEAPALPGPYYTYESTDTVLLMLRSYILPSVLVKEIESIEDLEHCYQHIKGHPAAKTAVESTYWHLKSQAANKPLSQLWGGVRDRVEAGISIGSEPNVQAVLKKIEDALGTGYRRIKVKIMPGRDVDVIKAIRDAFGDITLMADGNSSYSLHDIDQLKRLDDFNLLMLEQPLGDDDLIDHAELQRQLRTPICLDESIHSREKARQAVQIGAAHIINVKPAHLGGYWQGKLVAEDCQQRGVPVWCGGMLETGIGKAFNIHLSSLENFTLPGDTSGTDQYFEEDVLAEPIVIEGDSCIRVPTAPGLGFPVSEKAIDRLTTAAETLLAE
jgi:o-succinylbenzoate synthase